VAAAPRVTAALVAALVLCGWQAAAAHATYGKVTIEKVAPGAGAERFTFNPNLRTGLGSGDITTAPFTLAAGQSKTYDVERNVDDAGRRISGIVNVVTEGQKPGWVLTGIVCRTRKYDRNNPGSAPSASAPVDTDTATDVAARRIDFGVKLYEWVKCWVTNQPATQGVPNQFSTPAIAIVKSGPADATAGDTITYTLAVSNPGPVSFPAAGVVVSDQLCAAAPALQSTGADASPGSLDPGDGWTYTCQVVTTAGQTSVPNVGVVRGTDQFGHTVEAQSPFTTTLHQTASPPPPASPGPGSQVLGVTSTGPQAVVAPQRGSARLSGPSGCRVRAVTASVTGRRIIRVTFRLDGRVVKVVRRARSGRWSARVVPRDLRYGTHRLTATVTFAAASGTRPRTLRLSFARCRTAAVRPVFTG